MLCVVSFSLGLVVGTPQEKSGMYENTQNVRRRDISRLNDCGPLSP